MDIREGIVTRDEALLTRIGMEQVGWVDLRISVSHASGNATYAVSGVDPTSGIRGGWRWQYADIRADDLPARVSTRQWLA